MAEDKVNVNPDEMSNEQVENIQEKLNHKENSPEVVENEEVTEPENELDRLERERNELQDKYLRLYSDFENFRRRTAKEKIELIDRASENVILELLPVVDDFERAIHSMNDASEINSVCSGVTLIFNKLRKILEDKGLHEIDCVGKEFDPEIHEALVKVPAPKKKMVGKIIDQIQKGYSLKGKVIRYSKVVVGE